MKIAIGNDHAATELKFIIKEYVEGMGHEVINFGTDDNESCDYPAYGKKVGEAVVNGDDAGNACLFSLLNNAILFCRVVIDQPDMGMSIKKLHCFFLLEGFCVIGGEFFASNF